MLPASGFWQWLAPSGGGVGTPAPSIASATVGSDGTTFTTVWSAAVNHSAGSVSLSGGRTATYASGDGTNTIVWTIDQQVYQGSLMTWIAPTGAVVAASGGTGSVAVVSGSVTNNSEVAAPSITGRLRGRLAGRLRPTRLARA